MLRMNSRLGVVATAFALIVTLGLAPDAHAQQTPRKPTTHKGSTKRSLVKKSAPVESKPANVAGADAEAAKQPDPASKPADAAPAPVAKSPEQAAGSPGSSAREFGEAAAEAAKNPPKKPKPLLPKTSSKRTVNPSPVGGTDIATEPTKPASPSNGPVNRVTDPIFKPAGASRPATTSGKTSVADSSGAGSGTSSGGESAGTTTKEPEPTSGGSSDPASSDSSDSGSGTGTGTGKDQSAGGGSEEPGVLDGSTMLPTTKPLPADPAQAAFHAWSWTPDNDQPYIFPMAWAASWRSPSDAARDVLRQPAGQRSLLFIGDIVDGMARHPDDVCMKLVDGRPVKTEFMSPWITNGIKATRLKIRSYLDQFVKAGGVIDGVVMDNETTLVAGYFIAGGNPHWEAIMEDPRFPQLAQDLGFSDLRTVFWGNPSYVRFNEVMGAWFDAALDAAVYQVVREFFPNATYSNYDSFKCLDQYAFPEISGFREVRDSHGLGTHDSRPYYGRVTAQMQNTRFDGRNAIGYTPYGSLLFETLAIRGLVNSRERPNHAWVAARSWTGDEGWAPTPLANSPHWDELVLQLGMHGVNQYLYWTNVGLAYLVYENNPNIMPRNEANNTVQDQRALNSLLEELNRVIGSAQTERVVMEVPNWDDRAIATGRRVGDEMIWRFSFPDGVERAKIFYTDGTHVVLQREPGRSGCWFSHPVTKTLVLDSDRSLPALQVLDPIAP